jgi:Phage tail tube protein, GTA-gp10
LDMSIFTLAQRLSEGELTLKALAVVLQAGLNGAGEDLPLDSVGQMLLEDGIAAHVDTAVRLLELALVAPGK